MGWFDEQIKQRKNSDNQLLEDALLQVVSSVSGGQVSAALNRHRYLARSAIEAVLRYYRIPVGDMLDSSEDMNEQLERLLRPHGFMRREVTLQEGWYRQSMGVMLGVKKEDGQAVAFLPDRFYGYFYLDTETGRRVRVNRKNQWDFATEAIAFYQPFPQESLGPRQFAKYLVHTVSGKDMGLLCAAGIAAMMLGLLLPKLSYLFFAKVIPWQAEDLFSAAAVFMLCITVAVTLLSAVKQGLAARIQAKMQLWTQAAAMMRLLTLPAAFFKQYSAGDLASRIQYFGKLSQVLVRAILSTGLTALFSLGYYSQIVRYAPGLAAPSFLVLAGLTAFFILCGWLQKGVRERQAAYSARENGMSYAILSGIQKIKLAGAEKRAFSHWANLYARQAKEQYDPPLLLKIQKPITIYFAFVGTGLLYYLAVHQKVGPADYYAFQTAYSAVLGAVLLLGDGILALGEVKPIWNMIRPILEQTPEVSQGKQVVTRLSGGIELNNVSFRYNETMPMVLDDLSLKIRPGQYVGIVGSSGCGKSTLLRLLLGFEKPQKGAVYYDGTDLAQLDLPSLRRKIGVVMQDSRLFAGDIYSNITLCAPWLTMEQAWQAAEMAGIAEDIKQMPMGMQTILSEGGGGISGGQRQRLLIARAIAPKPRLLMFDEATSALDNCTQKIVSESLDHLKCTRIVIAHRLSTVQNCDRILVLDKGRIVEDGNYQQLMEKQGFFAALVKRQQLES